jgi:uncharacterized membrane protein YkvA (DUF1232 family)
MKKLTMLKHRSTASAKSITTSTTNQTIPTMQVAAVVKDGRAQAESFAKQPRKLKILLDTAVEKAQHVDKRAFKDLWLYLLAMLRLIRSYCSGKYKQISWEALLSIIVAIAYFTSPLDLIPDFLPGIGYIDDAMIIRFVYRSVKTELERFIEWESGIDQIG